MKAFIISLSLVLFFAACQRNNHATDEREGSADTVAQAVQPTPVAEPLAAHMFTADPSAHVFDGRIYVYHSHDIVSNIPADDEGAQFDMKDYHVLSMDEVGGEVTDHGVALDIKDIPWVGRQLWAPDAAHKDGKYYFYFPAKDKDDIFRIGVATGDSPAGPFTPEPDYIPGSYSIDPAVFTDTDGKSYMYFGGIWGGQLQRWDNNQYDSAAGKTDRKNDSIPAIGPRVARMSNDMLSFAEPVREIQILDPEGNPILGGDHDRRFFEAAWMHRYNGKYYLSYSTGDTHYIVYAISENPYGPFTYQGVILNPVVGWTNHHSIVEKDGQWYLFYHDSVLSGGETHLRNVRVMKLAHDADGKIQTLNAYVE